MIARLHRLGASLFEREMRWRGSQVAFLFRGVNERLKKKESKEDQGRVLQHAWGAKNALPLQIAAAKKLNLKENLRRGRSGSISPKRYVQGKKIESRMGRKSGSRGARNSRSESGRRRCKKKDDRGRGMVRETTDQEGNRRGRKGNAASGGKTTMLCVTGYDRVIRKLGSGPKWG